MIYKLLVNAPSGEQKIETVTETGAYFDQNRIVWDERKDGNIPDITIGKTVRNGKNLDTLPDYLPAHAACMASKQSIVDAEKKKEAIETETKKDAELAALRGMSGAEIDAWFDANVTNANQCIKMLKKVVKALVKQNLL